MKYKTKQKNTFYRNIKIIILSLIMIYCLYQIIHYIYNSYCNNKLNSQLQELYIDNTQEIKTSENNINNSEKLESKEDAKINFKDLLAINSEVVGWIKIQDTNINYPVVKGKDNEYYLNHNIKKESSASGSIFMDYRNKVNEEDLNTIIYGHNMKDGSMFKTLASYKEEDFLINHPIIELTTLNKTTKWEIFSVYITDTSFNYIRTNFENEEDYGEFLSTMKNKSIHDVGINVTSDDVILTLSTCTYEFYDARFAIHARLVRE
ncbi:class B sortase [Clostridium sp. UBA4395]|uniref:class B sortase n=1 Tax=Clostridium sp. UBA4395 TaxID=1946360 RepID=UPI003217748F